jgi:hypothetical protein
MINIAKAKAGRKEIRILAPVVRARTFGSLMRFRVMSDLPVIRPQYRWYGSNHAAMQTPQLRDAINYQARKPLLGRIVPSLPEAFASVVDYFEMLSRFV